MNKIMTQFRHMTLPGIVHIVAPSLTMDNMGRISVTPWYGIFHSQWT